MDDEPGLTPYQEIARDDVGAVAQRFRLALPNVDISETKDPCGFLRGENDNLPKFTQGLLASLLGLEKEIYALKGDDAFEDKEFTNLGRLVTFLSRLLYFDPEAIPSEEELNEYSIDHFVRLYLPHNQNQHLQEIYPPSKYDFRTPAIVGLIIKNNHGEQLTMEVMPVLYSYYQEAPDLNGQSLNEVRKTLAKRRRLTSDGGMLKTNAAVEGAKVKEPFFRITYEDKQGNSIIATGSFIKKNGHLGINLRLPSLDKEVFLPLDLKDKAKKFTKEVLNNLGKNPLYRQALLLARMLLTTKLKTMKNLKEAYKKKKSPKANHEKDGH